MKIPVLIKLICVIGCIVSATLFVMLAYDDFTHLRTDNFFKLVGVLGGFWMFFYIGFKAHFDYDKPEEYPIPEEGRLIRITWLDHCRNVPSYVPNPYIGMIGRVRNVKPGGSFDLQCETCWLILINKYKFEYLD